MKKSLREQVKSKYGGHCAYCGKIIGEKFDVDHIVPIYRLRVPKELRKKTSEEFSNLNPSCRSCNNYKNVLSLEDFRKEIASQVERGRKYCLSFRLAEAFGLFQETGKNVVFYFEKYNQESGMDKSA